MKCFDQKDELKTAYQDAMDPSRALDITGFGHIGTFTWEDIREEKKQLMLLLANFVEDINSENYEEYEILKELEYYSLKLRALNSLQRLIE